MIVNTVRLVRLAELKLVARMRSHLILGLEKLLFSILASTTKLL